jgi:hypothetical protein
VAGSLFGRGRSRRLLSWLARSDYRDVTTIPIVVARAARVAISHRALTRHDSLSETTTSGPMTGRAIDGRII